MKLTIVSPNEKKEYEVNWIEVHTTSGSFIIQPGHTPIIARLSPEKPLVFSTHEGIIESIRVSDGILQHMNNSTFVIVTS